MNDPSASKADQGTGTSSLFTVAPGVSFLDCIASSVLSGELPAGARTSAKPPPSPREIAALTIYLPTRRACRAIQDAFLRCSASRALLLPRLVPVGDVDDDALLFSDGIGSDPALSLEPAIDPLARQVLLARLILDHQAKLDRHATGTRRIASTPGQAVRLAKALARFIDEIETENVPLDRLAKLVPHDFSSHWQTTLDFLKIVTEELPKQLRQRGLSSPAALRTASLLAEARRIATGQVRDGVIVAGVTGSVPATVDLMAAVARHPLGAVVIPGLDLELDGSSFDAICPLTKAGDHETAGASETARSHPEHTQYVLAKLLRRLGYNRGEVQVLGAREPDEALSSRARLLSETMRPATTTESWSTLNERFAPSSVSAALEGVSLLELPTPLDEAETVALILRETLEKPGQTAALVTPDRLLARRVVTRLAHWGIEIDDSAGRPFRKTECGTLLELVFAAAGSGFGPIEVTALLKHPLVRLGLPAGEIRRRARNLEIAVFRTVYLGRGLTDLTRAVTRAQWEVKSGRRRDRAVKVLSAQNWSDAEDLTKLLARAFEPLDALLRSGEQRSVGELVGALAAVLTALTAGSEADAKAGARTDTTNFWEAEGGEIAADWLSRLRELQADAPALRGREFGEFLANLVAGETVRPITRAHPRLSIWGPFEARLQQPDVVVLGGLNEGTWPQIPEPGPWINRPMRFSLGLPQPEESLGRAAHDFSQLFLARTVYLTRSEKSDGKPTIPSRWLMRLRAVLSALDQPRALEPHRPWRGWAANRTALAEREIIRPPAPTPPVALRPKQLSVSDIERWIANPYTIFASRILKLQAMPPLDRSPDAAIRGAIVHDALNRFAERYPKDLPENVAKALIEIADDLMRDYEAHASVAAFWRPRFERFARWFAETEPGRRENTDAVMSEVDAALKLDCSVADFTITARADRIDRTPAGLFIYDYKGARGVKDLARQATEGLRPQLLLEAALANAGAFAGVEQKVAGLAYISTAGGDPAGEQADLKIDDIPAAAARILSDVAELADRFALESTPYPAVRRSRFDYRFDDYAHLARVTEWSGQDRGEDGGGA